MTVSWIDEAMSVVDGVDWGALKQAYGSAELTPLALRTWLSGDDRPYESIDEDDDIFAIIADYRTPMVADSALAWIYVSVFHQGSLFSASAPTCQVMVKALECSPVGSVRSEALAVLAYCLRIYESEEYFKEWQADGFHRLSFSDVAVYDAIDAGWSEYVHIAQSDEPPEMRLTAAAMLAWMSRRNECAEAIIDTLNEERPDDLGGLARAQQTSIEAMLVRSLGILGRDTDVEDLAEQGIRAIIDSEGSDDTSQVGRAACIALARLRRVSEHDHHVLESLQDALADKRTSLAESQLYLDALMLIALHCAPRWRPDDDRAEAARAVTRDWFAARTTSSPTNDGTDAKWAEHQRRSNALTAAQYAQFLERHHRLDANGEVSEGWTVRLLPELLHRPAHSCAIDADTFGIAAGKKVSVVSLETLRVERTLTITAEADLDRCVVAVIDNPKLEELGEHLRTIEPFEMRPSEPLASPDGRWFAAGGTGMVAVWDLSQGQSHPVAFLTGFMPTRVEFAWSPDSRQLVTSEGRELHFWDVTSWSAPQQVALAVHAERLAWMGENPTILQRDRAYRWNLQTESAERVEIGADCYPIGVGHDDTVLVAQRAPLSRSRVVAQRDSDHWIWVQTGMGGDAHLQVASAKGKKSYTLAAPTSWAQTVWWSPDGRFAVHQNGNTTTFRTPDGDEVASCTIVDSDADDLVWVASVDGDPLLFTDRTDVLSVRRGREFDRPEFLEDPAELLDSLQDFERIRALLRP